MDIVLHSMGMPFNGNTINEKSLGGSESAAYYLAKELAAKGHAVKVFTSSKDEGEWDGVKYLYHGQESEQAPLGDRFSHYAAYTPHDALIIQRHPLAFHRDYASKVNIWQLHDLALHRTARVVTGGLSRINVITTVSDWHKNQVADVWGINKDVIAPVPNGVDPALYEAVRSDGKRCERAEYVRDYKGFKMLYQSRPERGLEHLVRPDGIMARLAKTHPDAHLFICGYENTVNEMAQFYMQLAQWGNDLPNVTHLGALTKRELAEVQSECDLLCYPTEFEEVSCITAMEAMNARLPLLTSPCAALPETCYGSGTQFVEMTDGKANEDGFVEAVADLIDNPKKLKALRDKQKEAANSKTWSLAADRLIEVIQEQMQTTPQRLVRHYIDHGDIIAAEKLLEEIPVGDDGILEAARREVATMYGFSRDAEENRKHYAYHEGETTKKFGGKEMIAENIGALSGQLASTRTTGIMDLVSNAVQEGARKILDFGCAYGHFSLPIAKQFTDVEVTGIDHVAESIDVARRAAEVHGITNAKFEVGTIGTVPPVEGGYDVILAAEVIEHIRDYLGALEYLRSLLSENGRLIITTPAGRWEWNGAEGFRTGREHLHHFERADINTIFAGMEKSVLFAPMQGGDRGHFPLGSFCYSVKPSDKPFNPVDYAAKHKSQNPRETISLCMIVKDGESDLRKSVNSVIDYVDEVVIRIDPNTTDDTMGVIDKLKRDNPHKSFNVAKGVKALEAGFDAARNLTIDAASGDWIMWLDADEQIVGADNLHRVLRKSAINAYAVAQHHYSVVPAQVLSTDYPARVFRNRRGTRFYGLVHEHPEDVVGEAINHTHLANDLQIMHVGYTDEPTRRRRFMRNFGLLQKDVEQNPNRILNKMLMLRDTAQSIIFAKEQGQPADFAGMAAYGVNLFEEFIEKAPSRMIIDALQYYSLCVQTLNLGFDAEVEFKSTRPRTGEPHYGAKMVGRFHNKDVYLKLVDKLARENIDQFDSKYF